MQWGTFAYTKIPFDLSNFGANFYFIMNISFNDLINLIILIYLDDLTIFSNQ